jgi:hypothetical protein
MNDLDNSFPHLGKLMEQRLAVVGELEESMEASRLAMVSNNAEAIARGAAHQAELCRQWSRLEERLRSQAERLHSGKQFGADANATDAARSAQLAAEWEKLSARIRYLTRVHSSLLRHMQRSLAVWNRMMASCAPTYTPAPDLGSPQAGLRAGD